VSDYKVRLKTGFIEGTKRGWSGFAWMCKIVIPLSFAIALLQWTGWLNNLDFILNPLMSLLNLPAEAALPIIAGMLINIYACIAIVSVVPFTTGQMTLIAIFSLIAHNLITESIIQHRSGINGIKIAVIRIVTAVFTVLTVSQFTGDTGQSVILPASLAAKTPVFDVITGWAVDTLGLIAKIFCIIMGLMIVLGWLRALEWVDTLLGIFRPLMRILGLPERTAMMFMAAVIFGLFYGSAVLIEEAKRENFTGEEMERLQISIGINHALVEDPALYVMLGLNAFWMWVPKIVMSVIAVQAYRGLLLLRRKLVPTHRTD
jgi:spore maturation protein SpmB